MSASMSKKLLAAVHLMATGVANNKCYWILHTAPLTYLLKELFLMHKRFFMMKKKKKII